MSRPSREVTLSLPPLRPYQKRLVLDPRRVVVTVSAPQIGKTLALAVWLLSMAWMRPGSLSWWAAPTYLQTVPGFRTLRDLAVSAGIALKVNEARGAMLIRLIQGADIEFRSWDNPDNLSGPSVHHLVADEAHLITSLAKRKLKDRLSDTLGPERYIGNSDDADGEFAALWEAADDPEKPRQGAVRWTWEDKYEALLESNPDAAADYLEYVENERSEMSPSLFDAVFRALWTESQHSVFQGVNEALTLEKSKEPLKGVARYVIPWDIAEAQTFTVGLPIPVRAREVDITAMERFRWVGYTKLEDRIEDFGKRFPGVVHVVELNGPGRPVAAHLRKRGLKVYGWTTQNRVAKKRQVYQPTKGEAMEWTASDIANGIIRLAPLKPLPAELKAVRREKTPSGNYVYKSKGDMTNDCVMSLIIGNAVRRMILRHRMPAPRPKEAA